MKSPLILSLCLAAATTVQAQMPAGDALPGFDRLDADGDGRLSREDTDRLRQAIFARLDRNGDGVVSTDEVIARQQLMQMQSELRQARLALTAARMDADADGAITLQDFSARLDLFAFADADGDGGISAEEAAALRARLSRLRP